ncbi:hypothetical protein scyTo_0011065 [Scyliorhinus torazame]|uniref:Uncharacterized protein n=1 Tax=Scyliorhinus torazame TaxID=75743 RepID=A0A401NH18_SCYTO|nr:hypothetical protein [Scyliorhinus torazame]
MYLFFGNKTSVQFLNFTLNLSCPGELQNELNVQAKPVEPVVEGWNPTVRHRCIASHYAQARRLCRSDYAHYCLNSSEDSYIATFFGSESGKPLPMSLLLGVYTSRASFPTLCRPNSSWIYKEPDMAP